MKGCGGFWTMLQPAGIRQIFGPKPTNPHPHHSATGVVPVSGYNISEAATEQTLKMPSFQASLLK